MAARLCRLPAAPGERWGRASAWSRCRLSQRHGARSASALLTRLRRLLPARRGPRRVDAGVDDQRLCRSGTRPCPSTKALSRFRWHCRLRRRRHRARSRLHGWSDVEINPEVLARAVDVLEQAARQRHVLTYKQLSEQVPGLPTRGPLMTATLLAVSERSWQQHQVLLPVLVVNSNRPEASGRGLLRVAPLLPTERRGGRTGSPRPARAGTGLPRLPLQVVTSLRTLSRLARRT